MSLTSPGAAEWVIPSNKKSIEEIEPEYRKYARGIALKLENLAPTSFEPSLTLFEDLLRSLNVAD
jgi:hypothetical protein